VGRFHVACTRKTVALENGVAGILQARESVLRHGAAHALVPRSASLVRWCNDHLFRAQCMVWWPHGVQQKPAGTSATFLQSERKKFKI